MRNRTVAQAGLARFSRPVDMYQTRGLAKSAVHRKGV